MDSPQLNYPDSATTSPGSRSAETWDEQLPPLPGAKLRLLCCYGGHIIPRPHDKALSYVGGDKRIVVVDRGVSLPELHRHLSHSLLNGQRFSLKYQLPHEELDSLVSISTDEDLENMVQEYDRTMPASPLRPRLRFFLFTDKPETSASAGCLLGDAKSEQWFIDAINDSGLVSRGFSDSAIDINMVDLDGISISKDDPCADLAIKNNSIQDNVQSKMPDSPSLESGVSSPSMAARPPPVKTGGEEGYSCARLNDQMQLRIEDQLLQMNVAPNLTTAGYILPSPDSVASESSIASAASSSKHIIYQDATPVTTWENRGPSAIMDPSSQILMHTLQQQPQLIQTAGTHYIHHPTPEAVPVPVPISSYYPMYAPPQQQPVPQQVDQQRPMYVLPVAQAPAGYNLPAAVQSIIADSAAVTPPNVTIIPPICATNTTTLYKPAAAAAASAPTPTTVVQVPTTNQLQTQQYFGLSQVPPPSQYITAAASPAAINYTLDYTRQATGPTHDQVYYAQHPAVAPIPSQFQTVTPATAVLISQATAAQLPGENSMQQIVTSQPL